MRAMTPTSPAIPAGCTHAPPLINSLDEERHEVFESVLRALAREPPDADRLAAGGYLLRHLSRTAGPAARTA